MFNSHFNRLLLLYLPSISVFFALFINDNNNIQFNFFIAFSFFLLFYLLSTLAMHAVFMMLDISE